MNRRIWTTGILIGLMPVIALADIFTVGPDGSYPTITAGVGAALATPGIHEVRLEAGHHVGTLQLAAGTDVNVDISGGWDAEFLVQSEDPALTDWRGSVGQPVLNCSLTGNARIGVSNVRINNGVSTSEAGGINALLSGTSFLDLSRLHVESNGSSAQVAAGLNVRVNDSSDFSLADSRVAGNLATGSAGQSGIGMRLIVDNNAGAFVSRTQFFSNVDNVANTFTVGGGLYVIAKGDAYLALSAVRIHSHQLVAPVYSGSALSLDAAGNALINIEQLDVSNNTGPGNALGNRSQVSIALADDSRMVMGSSAMARGNGTGLVLNANTTGSVHLYNLTIAGHPESGIEFYGSPGQKTFYNSIVHGNMRASFGNDVTMSANLGGNINGVDPMFVSAPSNLRLQAGSPAIDAGNPLTPNGGVGLFDVEFNPREIGDVVDIGAYEHLPDALFRGGFEDVP